MDLLAKAQPIRLMIFDVDGILTSGLLFYNNEGQDFKGFHVQDGLGIKLLQQSGVTVAIISAKNDLSVQRRMQDLGLTHVYLGHANKLPVYEALKNKLNLADFQIAFAGDDLPDLPILKRVGLSITVPHSYELIAKHAHMITQKESGQGAAREICDFILKAQGNYEKVIAPYLQ